MGYDDMPQMNGGFTSIERMMQNTQKAGPPSKRLLITRGTPCIATIRKHYESGIELYPQEQHQQTRRTFQANIKPPFDAIPTRIRNAFLFSRTHPCCRPKNIEWL